MAFPATRMRRMRATAPLRGLARETELSASHLVYPMFVVAGGEKRAPIASMPGIDHLSIDGAVEEAGIAHSLGIPGVLRSDGVVDNDQTLELLARTAVSQAEAGADAVAPSDMMDGRVGALRAALDEHGLSETPLIAYSAKYASAFYGPFREAADSAPAQGDRKGYQMDPANALEAVREAQLDAEEGADIVMVKPALPYLDVIRRVKDTIGMPVAAYNVSGEYAMVKAAAQQGLLDERAAVLEALTGIRRAGADIVITYHAKDVARWLD